MFEHQSCLNISHVFIFQDHAWVTRYGDSPLPTEEQNCLPITVTDEDMENSVKIVPKIETLVSKRENERILKRLSVER